MNDVKNLNLLYESSVDSRLLVEDEEYIKSIILEATDEELDTEEKEEGMFSKGIKQGLKNLAWYIAKVVDPTGVLSWPDFGKAISRWMENKTYLNALWVLFGLYCIIPSFVPTAAAAVTTGAAGGIAAPVTGAVGGTLTYTIWTIIKGIAKLGPRFVLRLPGGRKVIKKVLSFVRKGIQNPTAGTMAFNLLRKAGFPKKTIDEVSNALSKLKIKFPPTKTKMVARGIQGGVEMGRSAAKDISKAAAGGGYAMDQGQMITPPGQTQAQAQADAEQAAGVTPIETPMPMTYTFGGRALTPAQAAALGPFATPAMGSQPGQMIPQNVPQGATPQQPFGREGMAPQEYMRPDRFNNPPTGFFGQQNYGNYAQNPYGYQQPSGVAGMIGNTGNTLGGMIGGMGSMAGMMAGSPVAALANMAGGLLGMIPGMGSVGQPGGGIPYGQGI